MARASSPLARVEPASPRKIGNLRMIWRRMIRYPGLLLAAGLALLTAALATLAIPDGFRRVIDKGFGGHGGGADIAHTFNYLFMIVAVLAVVVIGVVVWLVGFNKSSTTAGTPSASKSASAPSAAAGTPLTPADVLTFNPYGDHPGNTENQVTVQGATDGDPATAWHTQTYFNRPNMGGSKPGTGLLLDMGKEVRLSQVDVTFSTAGGPTTAAVYLGNDATDNKATGLSNFKLVSPSMAVSGNHPFACDSQATGRYVLIWLTNLPKLAAPPPGVTGGQSYYQGQIFNVVVKGSAASGNS